MPFQSEKQRRYLWANEPEIARDWTDTYGSGIAKALGGRINYLYGGITHPDGRRGFPGGAGTPGGYDGGSGSGSGPSRDGPPGGGDRQMTYTAPVNRHSGPTTQQALAEGQRKKDLRDLLARQQAEKDYTRQGIMKPGPQLDLVRSGGGPNIGNWASGFAGSKIGGGLGSMLFGPWGALLGALFGRGVGQRAYQAYQTPEEETAQDILLGQNTLLSNLFNKKKTPTNVGGEGLGGIDLSDMRDKFNQPLGDKPSEKMYWDEQEIPMPKDLDADITELENWMSENPQQVQQKHINFVQALKTAKHNKMREANPNLPGTRVRQLWE